MLESRECVVLECETEGAEARDWDMAVVKLARSAASLDGRRRKRVPVAGLWGRMNGFTVSTTTPRT